jgi:hypothetical protein
VQLLVQKRIISNVLTMTQTPRPPLAARLLDRYALLRRLPARLVGMGFRPEHVETPVTPA